VVRLVAFPKDRAVYQIWEAWEQQGTHLIASTLLYYEVSNALYSYQTRELIRAASVRLALDAALALPVRLYGDPALHLLALKMAERFSLPAVCDAHYLAVAERLGAEMWTLDRRLVHSVASDLPWVHFIE